MRALVFYGMLSALLAASLTGCEITDPDWQAREQHDPAALQSTTPPPPRQWDFMGTGPEDKRMQDYNWSH
jgi:hypothetical protein